MQLLLVSVDTPARLLRMLALLSSRGSWRGDELAERLEVTERSIRRDITRLRDLGYPVQSVTGLHGGYSLAAGGRLPPLLLDDDEAVSIAVALHDIAQRSTSAIADSALSALTKLGQVMPATLREQVSALSTVLVGVGGPLDQFADGVADVEVVMALGQTCSRHERTRFDYRAGDGAESVRHVEPFRLVSVGRRWYLVAFDLDRDDWRTFRVDRVSRVRSTGARFVRIDPPDAAEFVAAGIAVNSYAERALVRFAAPADVVAQHIPPTIGVIRRDPKQRRHTVVEIGGDADWIARFLAGSALDYEVLEPQEVRDELRKLGRRLLDRNDSPA
ncbi:MAG: DNA-binding transcriptional regulator [Ilumatobacteraceae bacterium]|nr:DNA-binding transcriptional regulator [Ilumatobacteraceae bacterium]